MKMESRSYKVVLSTFILSILVFSFQNCSSDIEFTELNGSFESPQPDPPEVVNLSFNKLHNSYDSNIDLIWMVDNSSSMAEETQIIRENLEIFTERVEQRSNLKMSLISSSDSDYGVTLPQSSLDKGYLQINRSQMINRFLERFIPIIPNLVSKNVVREKSQKVIIMVGDDDFNIREGLNNEEFLSLVSESIDLNQLKIYSFINQGGSSSCSGNEGVTARELSKITDGKSFDICEANWSEYFEEILSDLAVIAKTEIKLEHSEFSNLEVMIDGILVDDYVVEGASLILSPSLFPEDKNYQIKVKYQI